MILSSLVSLRFSGSHRPIKEPWLAVFQPIVAFKRIRRKEGEVFLNVFRNII
jgi:hypothetical protein